MNIGNYLHRTNEWKHLYIWYRAHGSAVSHLKLVLSTSSIVSGRGLWAVSGRNIVRAAPMSGHRPNTTMGAWWLMFLMREMMGAITPPARAHIEPIPMPFCLRKRKTCFCISHLKWTMGSLCKTVSRSELTQLKVNMLRDVTLNANHITWYLTIQYFLAWVQLQTWGWWCSS